MHSESCGKEFKNTSEIFTPPVFESFLHGHVLPRIFKKTQMQYILYKYKNV